MSPTTATITVQPSWEAQALRDGAFVSVTHYVDQETGEPTDDPARALSVTLRLWPTMADGVAIDMVRKEVAGGWRELGEMEASADALEVEARDVLVEATWPDKDAVDLTDPAAEQHLNAAWMTWEHPLRDVVLRQRDALARLRFMAIWEVTWVKGPDAWRKLRERPLSIPLLRRVMSAHAIASREREEGNGLS